MPICLLIALAACGRDRHDPVYNLTSHDLASPANYGELKNILAAAAR